MNLIQRIVRYLKRSLTKTEPDRGDGEWHHPEIRIDDSVTIKKPIVTYAPVITPCGKKGIGIYKVCGNSTVFLMGFTVGYVDAEE